MDIQFHQQKTMSCPSDTAKHIITFHDCQTICSQLYTTTCRKLKHVLLLQNRKKQLAIK